MDPLGNIDASVDELDTPNYQNNYSQTGVAILENEPNQVIGLSLDAKIGIDEQNSFHHPVNLVIAAHHGNHEIVKVLLDGMNDVNQGNYFGTTPLMMASRSGNQKIARMLLDAGAYVNQNNYSGTTALMMASRSGNEEIVMDLLKVGADINQSDNYGATSLMISALQGSLEILQILLKEGADVNQSDDYGVTSLMISTRNGRQNMVEALLNAGADVNQSDKYGTTALAIAAIHSRHNIIDSLLNAGADIDQQDNCGTTPLMIAAIHSRHTIVASLLDKGADSNIRNNDNKTAFDIYILLCNDKDLEEFIPKPTLNQTYEFKGEDAEPTLVGQQSRDSKNSYVSFKMGNGITHTITREGNVSPIVEALEKLSYSMDFDNHKDNQEEVIAEERNNCGDQRADLVRKAYKRAKEISESKLPILK